MPSPALEAGYSPWELLADIGLPAARLPVAALAPWTSSSEICAAGQPVLAVTSTRT